MRTRIIVLVGAFLLIISCGGGEDTSDSTSTTEAAPSTTTTVAPTTTSTAQTTTTVAATTTTSQQIDVTFEGGVVTGPGRVTATVGDEVSVWVISDVDAEIHVHGYDLFFDAAAGAPVEVTFTADVPGIFEVEVEGSHTLLFELEVTP